MSSKKLKKHRKLHGIKIPCPICMEYRPKEHHYLIVKCCRYITYFNDLMWDGATSYLNKNQLNDKKEKVYYEIKCTNHCDLGKALDEKELELALIPYLETITDELVKVPAPPNVSTALVHIETIKDTRKWRPILVSRNRKADDARDMASQTS